MNGNKSLLVTCVYNNLYGTKIGGRYGRNIHYTKSLATLTKMEQDMVVYTTEEDKNILLSDTTIKNYDRIRFIIHDLYSDKNHNYFQLKKEELKDFKSDRCHEIMHNKVKWMSNHVNEGYDSIYWIDAGLSHGALIPIRFRGGTGFEKYFDCSLFTPKVIDNLKKIQDKIILLAGNQEYHIFDAPYSSLFNVEQKFKQRYHVVGGFFGGSNYLIKELNERYDFVLNRMIELGLLEREEHLLTLLLNMDSSFFHHIEFTTWHHEDSDLSKYNKENEIYFYKIFENLND